MSILLLDERLRITVYFDHSARSPEDICLYLEDSHQDGGKILRDDEIGLRLTPGQARALADEIVQALNERQRSSSYNDQ